MGISTDAILVYGLSFDEGDLDVEDLAAYLNFRCTEDDAAPSDLYEPLEKRGLKCVTHQHCESPVYIIGCSVTTASRGYPEKMVSLPEPTADQAAELARMQAVLGGELGVWLCSYSEH